MPTASKRQFTGTVVETTSRRYATTVLTQQQPEDREEPVVKRQRPAEPRSDNAALKDDKRNYDAEWWKAQLGTSWYDALKTECDKSYILQCLDRVEALRESKKIFPPADLLFHAFHLTPLHDVRVVIVGQDPYHGERQAMGLCFSVPDGVRCPPSLVNIVKEIASHVETDKAITPHHGNLTAWAEQGVLLLNTILSVECGKPLSHKNFGWQQFTNKAIDIINRQTEHVVFLLWGSSAKEKKKMVDPTRHCVLESGHPSPLSVRFFSGCDHFRKANAYLSEHGREPVDWLRPWTSV